MFLFLHSNYNLRFATQRPPPSVDPSGYALKHQLPMLTHVIRERKVWPPGQRSKPAVDPRKVETGSVHVIQKLREGKWLVSAVFLTLCLFNKNKNIFFYIRRNMDPGFNVHSKTETTYFHRFASCCFRIQSTQEKKKRKNPSICLTP